MLRMIDSKNLKSLQKYLESRQEDTDKKIVETVEKIIEDVKVNKDKALKFYTEKFDQVKLDTLIMSKEEIDVAYNTVDPLFIENMLEAKENIEYFHKAQLQNGYELKKERGIYLGQRVIPLEKVGVYVPGGRAAYPSSVLMNVIPARIAGVKEIIMVTPPSKDGRVNPYIVAAAKIAGVNTIYKVGGAQAVAALAYGTESIPKVDKIVGPGNVFVATAKKLVYGKVDIDMIAGPSEILVVADEKANPKYVAADLISQAEHDPMASSILLTTSDELVNQVNQELKKQTQDLPKKDIIQESFAHYGTSIVCDTLEKCIEISNQIAPEHLELMIENAKDYLDLVTNAGSIFLGYYTCESIGDYFGGTNHVLPTNGTARFYSALSCDSFVKKSSYLYYTKEAILNDGQKIINIAQHEKLDGHANAVKVRLDSNENN